MGDEKAKQKWMLLDFNSEDCKDLFDMLDDGDGEIELEEFFAGLPRIQGQAQAKDVFRLQKNVDKMYNLFLESLRGLQVSGFDAQPLERGREQAQRAETPKASWPPNLFTAPPESSFSH